MNKLKILLLTKGYNSLSDFTKEKQINYQNFRNLFYKQELTLKDVINLSEILEISFNQCLEIFLPEEFNKIKEIEAKFN